MACNVVGLLACEPGKENGESICMGMLHKKFSLRRGTPSLLLVCLANHRNFVGYALDKTSHTFYDHQFVPITAKPQRLINRISPQGAVNTRCC
jgi:hypothetical protein